MIDLILKDIDDLHIRENFFRLKNFINNQPLFDGEMKLFDVEINARNDSFRVLHGLTFTPTDVLTLSVLGDHNFSFRFQDFSSDSVYISAEGPVRIKFLAGKFKSPKPLTSPSAFVRLGETVTPASPPFVFTAAGAHGAGDWLKSQDLASNICGVPVLFDNGVVDKAVVMTSAEAAYTIGVYQHNGQASGITLLGQFNVPSGGVKIFDLNYAIAYPGPNVQLATKIISGSPSDLRVSLVVRGLPL